MEQRGEMQRGEMGQQSMPPMPDRPPDVTGQQPLVELLRMPRPDDAPLGVWRAGYTPRPEEEPERMPVSQLAFGASLSALAAWIIGAFLWSGYLGTYWMWPLFALTPDSWQGTMAIVVASYLYYAIALALLLGVFGRIGNWAEVGRRVVAWMRRQQGDGVIPRPRTPVPPPESDPASWAELRGDGAVSEAERLTAELQSGRATDVDHARILHAWRQARSEPDRRAAVTQDVQRRGAGACPHGSGARDLQGRSGRHDLTLRQVRVGEAIDVPRNPYPYRTAGLALDPALLATGLLAVGPTGSGKTRRVVRPIVESLCLQALTGAVAVVVVTDQGDNCAPRQWFDAVLDATPTAGGTSEPVLDLFGGSEDADEAGAIAAEALVGDLSASLPGGDIRAAATTMAQLIGPHRAVHGCWPEVEGLRDLFDGGAPLDELRAALESKGLRGEQRELASAARQMTGGGVVPLMADRLTLLDRPALAGLVSPTVGTTTALDRLGRPVRVRVDLPEGVHAQAGRILARLVLAKAAVDLPRRASGGPWPCLVLDDATATVTPQSLQSLQRLRSGGCGVVLTLRALADVPEQLRQQVVSVAGCRVVCAGVAPWDAAHFASAWGTEVVEDITVTDRQIHADEPMQKLMYGIKKLATGRHVTVQNVTKKSHRRQRWPADDLATEVPGGHAVISVTAADGARSSPILIRLGNEPRQ